MTVTVDAWAEDLLVVLGAPDRLIGRRFLSAWAEGENTRAAFNPLATTQSAFGGLDPRNGESNFNSARVKNFTDYPHGLAATVATITNGFYPSILAGLRSGGIAWGASVSLELDTWGTGGAHVLRILELGLPATSWIPPSLIDATRDPNRPSPAPPAPPRETSMVIIVSAEHDTVYAVENGKWTEIDDAGDAANAMQQLPHFTWSAATIANVRGH